MRPAMEERNLGTLADFDLARIIADFGTRFLVETGTGSGGDVEFAAGFPFDHVYSIESSHKLAIQAAFRNARNQAMTILHGRNGRGLKDVLNEIPAEAPVIYWLDSHPSAHDLEQDLRLIVSLRSASRDVFLIDDLRIYQDGDYGDGPCPPEQQIPPYRRNLEFVGELLGASHDISTMVQRTGYLCAFPRS